MKRNSLNIKSRINKNCAKKVEVLLKALFFRFLYCTQVEISHDSKHVLLTMTVCFSFISSHSGFVCVLNWKGRVNCHFHLATGWLTACGGH